MSTVADTDSSRTTPATRSRRTADQTREHVLDTAGQLFYWHGIRSTGIDRVAREAAVAPPQIYRIFRSKDELVTAYVQRNDEGYRRWFDTALADGGDKPRRRLLALFDALATQVRPEVCRGCPFLMTLAEFPERDHPAHQHAVGTKRWVRQRLLAETRLLAAEHADDLADDLALVMEGVYASVQALGHDGPARRARALVEQLLPHDHADAGR